MDISLQNQLIVGDNGSNKAGTLPCTVQTEGAVSLTCVSFVREWKVSGQACRYSSKLLSSELVHDIFQPEEGRSMLFALKSKSHG